MKIKLFQLTYNYPWLFFLKKKSTIDVTFWLCSSRCPEHLVAEIYLNCHLSVNNLPSLSFTFSLLHITFEWSYLNVKKHRPMRQEWVWD